jgi:uncharacterized membrane protein YidH (DUF202 family)
MRTIGILLLAVGILVLVYGGFSYNRNHTVMDVGSVHVTATEHKNVTIPAIVGVVVLIGGAVLLVSDRRRA